MKTVEDLKALREQLVERRRQEAYNLGSAHHQERLEALVLVHTAILALDDVIAQGKDAPDPSVTVGSLIG
jgi:hypothetical protein